MNYDIPDEQKILAFDMMREWLRQGAVISAIDRSKVLEPLSYGSIHSGLNVVFGDSVTVDVYRLQ